MSGAYRPGDRVLCPTASGEQPGTVREVSGGLSVVVTLDGSPFGMLFLAPRLRPLPAPQPNPPPGAPMPTPEDAAMTDDEELVEMLLASADREDQSAAREVLNAGAVYAVSADYYRRAGARLRDLIGEVAAAEARGRAAERGRIVALAVAEHDRLRAEYKTGRGPGRANPYHEGGADALGLFADLIREAPPDA